MVKGAPINVLDYGAVGNDTVDCTVAIQSALTAAAASKKAVYIPAGTYKITSSLSITDEIKLYGDGNQTSILKLYTDTTATFALVCNIPDNYSIFGLDIGHIGITCNGGSAKGNGIYWGTTATNSAISLSAIHDVFIRNATTGVSLNGVVYMSEFARVIVDIVDGFGWRTVPISGQVIYNTFQNLQVTGVASSAYAYYCQVSASHFKNLTCDGCSFFDGAYNTIDGFALEGIFAATTPSIYAVQCRQIMSVKNIAIIDVPNSKCQYALSIESPCFSLSGMRVPSSGAGNQPNRALQLYVGNTGTISDIQYDVPIANKLEDYTSDAILNNFVFTNCSDVTDRNLVCAQGSWTPVYATNWSVAPATISAQYSRVGRVVTVTLYALGGASLANATISGLPFASVSPVGCAAAGVVFGDTTLDLRAGILPSETVMRAIPARTLTGLYWSLTTTYFV